MSRAPDRADSPSARAGRSTRPFVVAGTDPVVAAHLFGLVSTALSRRATPTHSAALQTTTPDDALLDRARWDEVVVLAALRDPLEGALELCRSDSASAGDAIDRTEQHVRTIELLAPHVVAIDVRPRLGPDLLAVRRAMAAEGVRVPTTEMLRSWSRWRTRPTAKAPVDRAVHGRLVLGVRGHHLDDRVAELRQRLLHRP